MERVGGKLEGSLRSSNLSNLRIPGIGFSLSHLIYTANIFHIDKEATSVRTCVSGELHICVCMAFSATHSH